MSPGELAIFAAAFVDELRVRDAMYPSAKVANVVEAALAADKVASDAIARAGAAQVAIDERASDPTTPPQDAIRARRAWHWLRGLLG